VHPVQLIQCCSPGRLRLPVVGSAHGAGWHGAADDYSVAAAGTAELRPSRRGAGKGRSNLIAKRDLWLRSARDAYQPAARVGSAWVRSALACEPLDGAGCHRKNAPLSNGSERRQKARPLLALVSTPL
jgi:hypothetical protein